MQEHLLERRRKDDEPVYVRILEEQGDRFAEDMDRGSFELIYREDPSDPNTHIMSMNGHDIKRQDDLWVHDEPGMEIMLEVLPNGWPGAGSINGVWYDNIPHWTSLIGDKLFHDDGYSNMWRISFPHKWIGCMYPSTITFRGLIVKGRTDERKHYLEYMPGNFAFFAEDDGSLHHRFSLKCTEEDAKIIQAIHSGSETRSFITSDKQHRVQMIRLPSDRIYEDWITGKHYRRDNLSFYVNGELISSYDVPA